MPHPSQSHLIACAALLPALAGLSACDGPQSALAPASSGAADIAQLWWVMFRGAAVIMLITVGLALYAVFRPARHTMPISPRTVVVVGGLVWPMAVLVALLAYAVPRGHALLPTSMDRDVLEVHITAHQWWWEIAYPDVDGAPLYTANELHIPAGRPVDVRVTTADVIHSVWIPRLAGKIDAIPGTVNVLRLEVEHPGRFRGQCAEYCGAQHARMALHVTAHTEGDFERQMRRLARPTDPGDADPTAPGRHAFGLFCARCHSVEPRRPGGGAPNLATIAERSWLGAGTLENQEGALLDWLERHQEYKPDNRMPRHDALDEETLAAIVAFLEDL